MTGEATGLNTSGNRPLESTMAELKTAQRALQTLSQREIAKSLAKLATLWREDSRWYREALLLARNSFGEQLCRLAVAALEENLSFTRLCGTMTLELGSLNALERWQQLGPECTGHVVKAYPLGVVCQILPGNNFLAGPMAIIQCLLSKNALLLKPSQQEQGFLELFYRSMHEAELDPRLLAAVRVHAWGRSDQHETQTVQKLADAIVVWGGSAAVSAFPQHLCKGKVVYYGPRLGIGLIASACATWEAALALAWDICLWEQRACSSPRLIFVREDEGQCARAFSKLLDDALVVMKQQIKPPPTDLEQSCQILTPRELSCWQDDAELITGAAESAHTVIWTKNPPDELGVGHRLVYIIPYASDAELLSKLRPYSAMLQTVLLSAKPSQWAGLVDGLANLGVTQVISLGNGLPGRLGYPHEGEYPMRQLIKLVAVNLQAGPFMHPSAGNPNGPSVVDAMVNSRSILVECERQSHD